ncbi:MAG: FtsW/RodA/SpoVE family cell cycle protein [Chitinophagales bacterium]|nr:FtsW/RodA/SpoVE family cell cycle protein [Chitinophagales bacterium]MDW8428740.1 FtsW/RodA/SpoVE family cell cycle protein [Chitinophagales bacterium]
MKLDQSVKEVFRYTSGDRYIWLVVIFLFLVSMLAVYSSTGTLAFRVQGGNVQYYLLRQGLIIGISLLIIYVAHRIPYGYYSRLAQMLLFVSVPLLILTLFFGQEINEARRWLSVPVVDLSFQTSDLARLALIMYIARMLVIKKDHLHEFRHGFLPIGAPVLLICGLIAPSNFSTAAILLATCLFLMFIGQVPIRYLTALVLLAISLLSVLVLLDRLTPFSTRVETWSSRLAAFADQEHEPYQVQQAKIAIAHGGIFGTGPGNSIQRNFLPSPYSDFIYAIIVEEYGLIGGMALVVLYLFLLLRSIRVARMAQGLFGAYLALGLGLAIVVQALINMAVVVDLLPTTGVTLPLISMGGTSTLFTSLAVGIILSVSRSTEQDHGASTDQNND